jgi:hypothetical protein
MRSVSCRVGLCLSPAARVCALSLGMCMVLASAAICQVQVLTEHNDGFRDGANTNETVLTPANVNFSTFGKLFALSVDGYIVGQPLYLPGVQFPDGTTHNVAYVATQHDSVFAFDADQNLPPLWMTSYIDPSAGITSVPISAFGCPGTNFTEVGIMSTPVIDPVKGTIYVVAKTEENGAFVYRLHGLSLTTGQDVITPAVISASASTKKGTLQFNPAIEMQRPALLLSNGTIYVGFGSNGCDSYAFHGWLLAYDESTFDQVGTFLTTPNGTDGAIWQAGGGAAVDTDGTIFLATGNGTFDASSGGLDYGDSMLHLSPSSSGSSGLTVMDYFTPYNQLTLEKSDLDLGSGGVTLLPPQSGPHKNEIVGGGKEGTLYLVDRAGMSGYNPTADTQIVQSIIGASTGELDNVPAYWNGFVYIGGEDDYVKAFSLTNGLLSDQPVSQTPNIFNIGGSGSVSVTSNSQLRNGILWATLHSGNASTLFAFNATNLTTELYDSKQAKLSRDALGGVAHFTTPTIADGRVYIGGTAALTVYGLLPLLSPAAGNNQSVYAGTTLTFQAGVNDAYLGNPVPNISVTCKDGGVGGTFSSGTVVTNSDGEASFSYTVPHKGQSITITCTNPGTTIATFSETVVNGPATRALIESGNNQTGAVSTQLPVALMVQIYDQYNFGVSGVVVTWSDGGAGGVFSAPTSTTSSVGKDSTFYTTPATKGTYYITATTPGITPAKFRVTVK